MKTPLKCVNFEKDLVIGKIYHGVHMYEDMYQIVDETGYKIIVSTESSLGIPKDLKHRFDWVKC